MRYQIRFHTTGRLSCEKIEKIKEFLISIPDVISIEMERFVGKQ